LGYEAPTQTKVTTESIAEKERDKTNRVDLLCKNNRGELIIIELQYYLENDYFQRMLFSASKLVLEYLSKNSVYGEIKKVKVPNRLICIRSITS
jgi:predicted transposase/invertase (TIGR01784 family)